MMIIKRGALVFWLLLIGQATSFAQDVTRLYSLSELQRSARTYSANIRGLWAEDFLSRLTQDERKRAGNVSLYLPLTGASRGPMDYYSEPSTGKVFLPISSVRFLDDLSIAFAYFERVGCGQGIVFDYVATLRFHPSAVTGLPLEVLGVPPDALADQFVNDASSKVLKSTVFFVAAHEYAHVMYRHKEYGSITAETAQAQEIEADAFALEVMARIGVPPLAMTYFFGMVSRLEPSPGQFASWADYEEFLHRRATHPVSASRILKVADGIKTNLDRFTLLQADPAASRRALQSIIPQLREIARTLDDVNMRDFLAARARSQDVAGIRAACPRH